MDPKLAQAIMQFMQRVQLTGAEVQAFVVCMNELQKLAQPGAVSSAETMPDLPPQPAKKTKAVSPNGPASQS